MLIRKWFSLLYLNFKLLSAYNLLGRVKI